MCACVDTPYNLTMYCKTAAGCWLANLFANWGACVRPTCLLRTCSLCAALHMQVLVPGCKCPLACVHV